MCIKCVCDTVHSNRVVDCINTPSHQLACVCENSFKDFLALCGLKFSEVVGNVVGPCGPKYFEYALSKTISDLMIAHVNTF